MSRKTKIYDLDDLENIEEDDVPQEDPQEMKSKRGAKQLHDPKPKGARRVLLDRQSTSDRPVNIYIERVTDADSGKPGFNMWWLQENCKFLGKQEIVKINPRTEEERTVGYEFTIDYDKKKLLELWNNKSAKTQLIYQDGQSSIQHPNPESIDAHVNSIIVSQSPTIKAT